MDIVSTQLGTEHLCIIVETHLEISYLNLGYLSSERSDEYTQPYK